MFRIPGFSVALNDDRSMVIITCLSTGLSFEDCVPTGTPMFQHLIHCYAGNTDDDGAVVYVPETLNGQIVQVARKFRAMYDSFYPPVPAGICVRCRESKGSPHWTTDGDVITLCRDCAEFAEF